MKTVAIIQARMGSTRLPGKVMLDLCGKPVLQRVIDRAGAARVDQVVVATTPSSEKVIQYCMDKNQDVFVGSEADVMKRVLEAADAFGADVIVDITADCPLIDPELINMCLSEFMFRPSLDYVSNCVPVRSYPDGMDCQVYKTSALKGVSILPGVKQHVGWNIPQFPDIFSCKCLEADKINHWPDLRLTLDTEEDFKLIENIYGYFLGHLFKCDAIIEYLNRYPELQEINKNVRTKKPEEG